METNKIENNKRQTGIKYEQAAGFFLEQMGYEILEYNYRCRFGEIDIIAKDGACLVFCEVKYRSGRGKGSPLEAVDYRKQQTIGSSRRFSGVPLIIWQDRDSAISRAGLM